MTALVVHCSRRDAAAYASSGVLVPEGPRAGEAADRWLDRTLGIFLALAPTMPEAEAEDYMGRIVALGIVEGFTMREVAAATRARMARFRSV